MSGTWGNNIKYTIFGESHGEGIGIVIDNLPPGIELDVIKIKYEMRRRSPGGALATARKEQDDFDILSGVFEGKTSGAPLCAFIKNKDQQSKTYDETKDLVRPGHADFTGFIKYKGFNDYRGGGHFSGRLTAAIVFAGAIAKQLLTMRSINIISHIYKIGTICDIQFKKVDLRCADLSSLSALHFPTIDAAVGTVMQNKILSVQEKGDSVGGIVETAILNLPAGIGSPFFDSLESTISHLIFSIPGVKGIEFGDGFSLSEMEGSEANDEFSIENEQVHTLTNHCGGILGGISTGMPLIFRAAFKPTPSITLEQRTVNIKTLEDTSIQVVGRHDPCIVPRALPVVDAAAAMAVLDLIPMTY
ncbi:MAG: chorismate synthase [Clostridiales bacterium GWB2_37_7]|nr:MAG: chorismate synthase [Clostridiales bacterium GWB2_37_7]